MYNSLLEWLEDFILQFEDAEVPVGLSDYSTGYFVGCKETQEAILQRLRYAIDTEKERIENK